MADVKVKRNSLVKSLIMRFIGYIRISLSLIFIITNLSGNAFSQNDSLFLVKYTIDFKFNDGFYLNFPQVKSNSPIPKSLIASTVDVNARNFFDLVIETKKIVYYDNLGVRHEVGIEKIWGYAKNGTLYINVGGNFNRITIVGNICHFIASIKTYQPGFYDPFMYNAYGGMSTSARMRPGGYETSEVRQLIFDFETGKIMEYTLENMESILSRDAELYAEFSLLKKKKKKQLKFVYLRKYNEKYPLYFPIKKE